MRRQRGPATWLVFALVILLIFAPIGVGTETVGAAASSHSIADGRLTDPANHSDNETTDRQPDQDSIRLSGDLPAVVEQLARRLTTVLNESVGHLDAGDERAAEEALDEQYPHLLDRYAHAAAGTASESDDQAADTFVQTAAAQRDFIRTVEDYRQTAAAFQEARRQGDLALAQVLAHHLDRRERHVVQRGETLIEAYDRLERTTDPDVDRPRRTVKSIIAQVRERQTRIRAAVLAPTELKLAVSPEPQRISFTRPLVVRGRLTNVVGEGLGNRSIVLRTGEESRTVQTAANGTFELAYRPVRLPLSTESVTVTYEPDMTSPYAQATAEVPVSVSQVTPTVTVDLGPDEAAYRDELVVGGSISVDGTPVSDVPIAVSIDGTERERVHAGPGRFRAILRMPGTVLPGEHEIAVRIPWEDRAIGSTATTWPVTVVSTPTALSATATDTGNGEVDVRGRLRTVDGGPVARETVSVRMNGEFVGTVRTTQSGSFATTFSAPSDQLDPGARTTIELQAAFDESDSNLEASTADTRLLVAGPPAGTSDWRSSGIQEELGAVGTWIADRPLGVQGGFIAGFGLSVLVVVVFREGFKQVITDGTVDVTLPWPKLPTAGGKSGLLRQRAPNPERSGPEGFRDDQEAGASADTLQRSDSPPASLHPAMEQAASHLAQAERALEAGETGEAVATAYVAVRRALGHRLGLPDSQTHAEFLDACSGTGIGRDAIDDLRWLTETYERTVYATEDATTADAERAVAVARQLTRLATRV